MNLKFGLLWLEDQFSEAESDGIKSAARKHGFQVEINNQRNGNTLDELAKEQEYHYPFDLILIDLDLVPDGNGADESKRARDLFPATPILFYSGKKRPEELVKMISERKVEGVFVSHRNDFVNRAGELIGYLAASFNRLAGMRGLAARVVAECDDHYRAILLHLGQQAEIAPKISALIDDAVMKSFRSAQGKYEEIKGGGLTERIDSRAVTSLTLHKVCRKIIRDDTVRTIISDPDAVAAARQKSGQYRNKVLEIRNLLGHALEKRTNEGWEISSATDDITVQRFPEIRESFLSNLEAITELRKLIVGSSLDNDANN